MSALRGEVREVPAGRNHQALAALKAGAFMKSGEKIFVGNDRREAGHRHREDAVMEDGDAEQRQPEQKKFRGNPEKLHAGRRRGGCGGFG